MTAHRVAKGDSYFGGKVFSSFERLLGSTTGINFHQYGKLQIFFFSLQEETAPAVSCRQEQGRL